MATNNAPIRYFLGTNTPDGFVSCTSTLYNSETEWHTYIIKGGAGNGKSTLLRTIYQALGNEETEVFSCSADTASLDAVRFPKQKQLFIDGTSPHVVEPSYWGVTEEIVPLFLATNKSLLRAQSADILSLTQQNSSLHTQCRKFLKAAQGILIDNQNTQRTALRMDKIKRTATQLAKSEWTALAQKGVEEQRFLSAVTAEALTVLSGTVQALCPRIFSIEDDYGAVSDVLLKQLRDLAVADGQHCVVCPCPLFPKSAIEHLLLPDIGVAFVTSNRYHKVDYPVFRRIHASRFLKPEIMQEHRNRLLFQNKAADELLQQASATVAAAKAVHDRLEERYAAATDWNIVNNITNELLVSLTKK